MNEAHLIETAWKNRELLKDDNIIQIIHNTINRLDKGK